jgi:excisionase family DNA binding protein
MFPSKYPNKYLPAAASLKPLGVSVNSACELIGVGKTKLYELISDGRVRSVKVGKRRLIDYASLEALVCPSPKQCGETVI